MRAQLGRVVLFILFTFTSYTVHSASYPVPSSDQVLIGDIQYAVTNRGDDVVNLAQKFDLGYNAIENANPNLQLARAFTVGTAVKLPTQHLLPNGKRQGIIINLPEMRMYYFPEGENRVYTYPIGIGKIGKTIPIKKTVITRKATNPTWTPPDDIREFNLEQGIVLPQVMPPGPDNPLGKHAIYMQIPTYLIHSTIFPSSVGKRASFGCIRMYENDIEEFFPTVDSGIPVAIINKPVKLGWQQNKLFMEVHEPLEEHTNEEETKLSGMVKMLSNVTLDQPALIDWQALSYIAKEHDGIPHEIGIRITP